MKRINNIYNNIVDINTITNMYEEIIRKKTKNKSKLERFEDNYCSNIINVYNILNERKYNGGKYNIFLIYEPKLRIIMSENISDKIINHLVSYYFIKPIFEKQLIDTNVATRINMGTHYGLRILKRYLSYMNNKYDNYYYLKFDISKYFFNIDHIKLKQLICNKIKDTDVINIINKIIDSTDMPYVNEKIQLFKNNEINKILCSCLSDANKNKKIDDINKIPLYKKGKGLPIGNLSSQMLAILYLNELDHFIKEKLHIKHYIRYMDDGILIHENKDYLKDCLIKIEKMLDSYKLKLNSKTQINSIKNGLDFLGFVYCVKDKKVIMKLRTSSKKRMKKNIKINKKLFYKNKIDILFLKQIIASYKDHLAHGNNNTLINIYLNIYNIKDK